MVNLTLPDRRWSLAGRRCTLRCRWPTVDGLSQGTHLPGWIDFGFDGL
jgi:hypothetical protein